MPRDMWWPWRGGRFLMGEVPKYCSDAAFQRFVAFEDQVAGGGLFLEFSVADWPFKFVVQIKNYSGTRTSDKLTFRLM